MSATDIEELRSLAEGSPTLQRAETALRDCYRVLMESGQLEVAPPRSLVDFFESQRDTGEGAHHEPSDRDW
ncbi:MAG: hypothetical protein WC718_00050 [Phycisphaerales bacterium]|jgi:hypothetical protein